MRNLLLAWAVAFAATASDAHADQTVVATPRAPLTQIIYGNLVDYTLDGPAPAMPIGYVWEYQLAGCSQWFPLTENNTGTTTQSCYEIFPGQQTVRCTITYSPPNGQNFTAQPSISINVPPPDTAVVTQGDRVSLPIGSNHPIYFALKCQGQGVLKSTGYAQERITNVKNPAGKIIKADMGWGPNDNIPRFYLYGGSIVDLKRRTRGAIYDSVGDQGILSSVTQALRVVITDPCGKTTAYPLAPSFSVKTVKDAPNNYHYEHD